VVALFIRSDITMAVEPSRNPLFVTLSDGAIRNNYTIRMRNQSGEDRRFRLSITSDEVLQIALEGTSELSVDVPADVTFEQRVYLIARPGNPAANAATTDVRFWLEDLGSQTRASTDSVFHGATR
ncbi:MAG: FixG Ig-like domain-containing protein, partial [Pseudomonadota bacterium]